MSATDFNLSKIKLSDKNTKKTVQNDENEQKIKKHKLASFVQLL